MTLTLNSRHTTTLLYRATLVASAVLVFACSSEVTPAQSTSATSSSATASSSGSASSSSSSGSGGAPGDVKGTIIDTRIADTGTMMSPPDTTTTKISAWVSSKGAFAQFPGTVAVDGAFVIQGVPEGDYYLDEEVDGYHSIYLTSLRDLDLGAIRYGRPDAALPTQSTLFGFDAGGLTPWQDTDSLELFSLGAGAWDYLHFQASPSAGGTSLQGLTFDAALEFAPGLVESTKGDMTFITQLATKSVKGVSYQSLDKVYTPTMSQMDGVPLTVNGGSFQAVKQTPVSFTWNRSQFEALAKDVNPQATVGFHSLGVYGEPAGDSIGFGGFAENLALFDGPGPDETLDLTYGNPFPASWLIAGYVNTGFGVQYTVPGTSVQKGQTAIIAVTKQVDKLASASIVPLVSPPRNVQVNGKSAVADLAGVGLSPTITWSAPTIGAAAVYDVTIKTNDPSPNNNYYLRSVAGLRTTSTSVTIPPGILAKGTAYRVVVTVRTDLDPKAPFHYATTTATADALTGFVTP